MNVVIFVILSFSYQGNYHFIMFTEELESYIYSILKVFSQGDICHVPGECQDSFVISYVNTDTYEDCQTECQGTQDCNYFSFYDPNDFCIMFYNCTTIDVDTCPECFTGSKDCGQQ